LITGLLKKTLEKTPFRRRRPTSSLSEAHNPTSATPEGEQSGGASWEEHRSYSMVQREPLRLAGSSSKGGKEGSRRGHTVTRGTGRGQGSLPLGSRYARIRVVFARSVPRPGG